jgi:hypothetical protein
MRIPAKKTPLPARARAAGKRVYAPVRDARKNEFTIAAADGPIETYGVTAEGALAAPGEITFGEFIRLPQTLEAFGAPEVSDATQLLLEFQTAFRGPATRGMLINFIRSHHSGKPRGFRYWNHLGAGIWKLYCGLCGGKDRTGKAHNAEVKRYLNAAKRAGKESERSALRRMPRGPAEARKLRAAKLQTRIDWLRSRAAKKRFQSQALTKAADALVAEAERLEANVHTAS